MTKSLSFTIASLCTLAAIVLVEAQQQANNGNSQLPVSPNSQTNPQQQQQQPSGSNQQPGNQMQNMIPNANQMHNMLPNQMQNMIPNQMPNFNPNQMQNMMPNGNQMPWFNNNGQSNIPSMPFGGNQMQQQMNPNQIGGALTNMLNRGMSLVQAFRQLLSSFRNGGQNGQILPNNGQMLPNNGQMMPNFNGQFSN